MQSCPPISQSLTAIYTLITNHLSYFVEKHKKLNNKNRETTYRLRLGLTRWSGMQAE